MNKPLIKNILYCVILIASNIIILNTFILFYGDNLIIEYKIKPEVFISLLIITLISSLILIKFISKYFEIKMSNIITWLLTIFFGSSLISYILSYIRLIYKLLNYQEKIYDGKFIKIFYRYDKADLLYYLEMYYQKHSGNLKPLTIPEKLKILGNAKTIPEVQQNVEIYHNQIINSWWTKISELSFQSIDWCFAHPYICGIIVVSISGLLIKPLWSYITSQIEVSQLANNVDSLNNVVSSHTTTLGLMQTAIHDIYTELLSQNTLTTILAKTLYTYFVKYNSFLDTQEDTEALRYIRILLLKFADDLTNQISQAISHEEVLQQQQEFHNPSSTTNPSRDFVPFTGEGRRLGED